MKLNVHFFAHLMLVGSLALTSPAHADPAESYGETFGRKILSGFANVGLSALEIPKTMIIVNNQSNVIFGVIGGGFKGLVNTIGRTGVGVLDLLTSPIPTDPIVKPLYVWDDFNAETTYGPAMSDSSH